MNKSVKSICGVILAAAAPEALARFYAEALGLEFEREDHGDLEVHYGVDIGQVHFGIHPTANLAGRPTGRASASIAFNVEAIGPVIERLDALGASVVQALHDEGFGPVASYADPEGNHFEIVELDYDFDA